MITYRCSACKHEGETSKCSACGGRAEAITKVFWCKHCNVPTWDSTCPLCRAQGTYLGTDIRPVFPEERLLMEVLRGTPMKYRDSSVWYASGSRYIIDGDTYRMTSKLWQNADPDSVRSLWESYSEENRSNSFQTYIDRWLTANRDRYNNITSEAMNAIQEVVQSLPATTPSFVSFSGGKDSTVTSSLVIRALSTPRVLHIYGNTTLEFPETEKYIKQYKAANPQIPWLVAKNTDKSFFDMCDVIGPPSRVMRWCCIVFKTGAITREIEGAFPTEKKILTFYGIRRSESASRSKYERETESPKISKQVVFSPIIDWLDHDVWLYTLTAGVVFNEAYRKGYTRVGCWCCPNNSAWSEFLSSVFMPEQSKAWKAQLIRFAKQVGKPDPEEYVAQGGWKARQGGNGLEVSKKFAIGFTPCATEENAFNYELSRPISPALYELFKPFGTLDFEMGNPRLGEVYVLDKNKQPLLRLQGRAGKTLLKVSILKLPFAGCPRIREAELKIKCQLAKYQICLGCMACTSVCKFNAIKITPTDTDVFNYVIDEKRCVHCGQCVNHFDGGCYMRDVIRTKN